MNLQLPAVNNIKTRSLIYNQIIIMNHKRTYKRKRGGEGRKHTSTCSPLSFSIDNDDVFIVRISSRGKTM